MICDACQSSDSAPDAALELLNPILREILRQTFLLEGLLVGLENPGAVCIPSQSSTMSLLSGHLKVGPEEWPPRDYSCTPDIAIATIHHAWCDAYGFADACVSTAASSSRCRTARVYTEKIKYRRQLLGTNSNSHQVRRQPNTARNHRYRRYQESPWQTRAEERPARHGKSEHDNRQISHRFRMAVHMTHMQASRAHRVSPTHTQSS